MIFWPFFWHSRPERWKAVSDDAIPVSQVPGYKGTTCTYLGVGDAMNGADGKLYVCCNSGYIKEPLRWCKTEAMVVPGRMKTPTELLQ